MDDFLKWKNVKLRAFDMRCWRRMSKISWNEQCGIQKHMISMRRNGTVGHMIRHSEGMMYGRHDKNLDIRGTSKKPRK